MLNKPIDQGPSAGDQVIVRVLIATGVLCTLNFAVQFFQPDYVGHPLLFWMLAILIVYGIARDFSLWYYYQQISVPKLPENAPVLTVDVLTTYYPGEPKDMVIRTLEAICAITYPHTTYLCDEANDPYLKQVCAELGVRHVTRTVRVNAKAGNINNALQGAEGEICLILDPDHIPEPHFLDRIVPYFVDPEIGFVQTVQVYYNKFESLVAKGAAQQTFHFYGPMMMTMNSFGTVNAIGANCTFRRSALDSIGGHAPGLAEDMHTAMLLYREGWKSVYVPEVLAKGLAPSTLTAYFSQQLKWARGTFDLLVKVFPRIFTRLTLRQKIHYALSSIHYLAGPVYLIGFLLPILSLIISDVPWRGDLLYFVLLIAPVVCTSFVLRFYIQRWLISDDERGFHLVGGVLEIVTWWAYTLGFVYTLVDKKVPYLPTPKDGDSKTHWSLLAPNIGIALISLFAVVYGLSRDFTPFSLVMAGFALLNVGFMAVSGVMAVDHLNRLDAFRQHFPTSARRVGRSVLQRLLWSIDAMTVVVRKLAPLILLVVTVIALKMGANYRDVARQTTAQGTTTQNMRVLPQFGIFFPSSDDGLSDLPRITRLELNHDIDLDLIASYVPWSGGLDQSAFIDHLRAITAHGARPLITWEPWVSELPASDTLAEGAREQRSLARIAQGDFDDYLTSVAIQLRDLDEPVLLRFAHEFDNPAYPWSAIGGNTPKDFVAAWRHVHDIFRREGAVSVQWVWNPWHADGMRAFFPGIDYVDYLGLTILDYGGGDSQIASYSFRELYAPFRERLDSLPELDVLVAEFGSLGTQETKTAWIADARAYIVDEAPEITGVVAFNSGLDKNLPPDYKGTAPQLDWTVSGYPLYDPPRSSDDGPAERVIYPSYSPMPVVTTPVRGVNYKKGREWQTDEYILSRQTLEDDFRLMQEAGINTISISDPGIYGYNVRQLAEEHQLGLILNFWIPETVDFLVDTVYLQELESEILETVEDWSDAPGLRQWNFDNDVLNKLANLHLPPELGQQRTAYLRYLNRLAYRVKQVDDRHPLTLSVQADSRLPLLLQRFPLLDLYVDGLSLLVEDKDSTDYANHLVEQYGNRVVWGDVSARRLNEENDLVNAPYWVVRNWQNEWTHSKVTTDGLLDFRGRRTEDFRLVTSRTTGAEAMTRFDSVAIISPANIAFLDKPVVYRAALLQEGKWSGNFELPEDQHLEWHLLNLDAYGNAVALTFLGEGKSTSLTLMKEHERFALLLTITDGHNSRTVRSSMLPER